MLKDLRTLEDLVFSRHSGDQCFFGTAAILGLGPLTFPRNASERIRIQRVPIRKRSLGPSTGWSELDWNLHYGAAIIAMTHGALGQTGWMKAAFALFLFLGFLHAMARRQFRKARESSSNNLPTPLRLIAWSMCAVTAAITYLMEAKPW